MLSRRQMLLVYRFGGRDMRLTDVHGNALSDILL